MFCINRQFIFEVVKTFHAELAARSNICELSKAELTREFYKRPIYQELYGLRYIPAYYFEYCVLASELASRLSDMIRELHIASFGCGLCPDYYALRDNLPLKSFIYTGFDRAQWLSQRHMPSVGSNHRFIHRNVGSLTTEDIADFDVFVFPKSIGDIRDGNEKSISHLGKIISCSPKKRIFFLNSYITTNRNIPPDLATFKVIHYALIARGFTTEDDVENTQYKNPPLNNNPQPIGLVSIHNDFRYPDGKGITCASTTKQSDDCKECPVPRSPILKNSFMAYQLLEYFKR